MYNCLYLRRLQSGLTQQELAERAGISRRTICRLEKEGGYPSVRVGVQISCALKRRFEEVFPLAVSM